MNGRYVICTKHNHKTGRIVLVLLGVSNFIFSLFDRQLRQTTLLSCRYLYMYKVVFFWDIRALSVKSFFHSKLDSAYT